MALDAVKNFCEVTVSGLYDEAATSINLITGDGAKLPTPPFNIVWYNSTTYPNIQDDPKKEIVRVTNIATDTLTVTRNAEGDGANTKNDSGCTYKMALLLTKKMIDDINTFIGSKAQASGLASLDTSSLVVQNPANATATPTASKIPIADTYGLLDKWILSGSIANVKDYGAIGNGSTDDTTAIQNAINAINTAGGGIVFIPQGTYLLSSMYDTHTFILPKDNVAIIGVGETSILKMKNGANSTLNNDVNIMYAATLNNCILKDFVMDLNGTNNLILSETTAYIHNALLYVENASNIIVENVTIKNNAGTNCLVLGYNAASITSNNIIVKDCRFFNNGKSIAAIDDNQYQFDHSGVWIQAYNGNVFNCYFKNDYISASPKESAIEHHGANSICDNNIIDNYFNAINVVAIQNDHTNIVYSNNILNNVMRGFTFFVNNNKSTKNLRIINNTILQNAYSGSGDAAFLFSNSTTVTPIDEVYIIGNRVINTASPSEVSNNLAFGSAIWLQHAKRVVVEDNYFEGTNTGAIRAYSADADLDLTIRNNTFVDCGKTTYATSPTFYKSCIQFSGSNLIKALTVIGNIAKTDLTTPITSTFLSTNIATGGFTTLIVENNHVLGIANHILLHASATITTATIRHDGNITPISVLRASAGSTWLNTVTGIMYYKTTNASVNTGWIDISPLQGLNGQQVTMNYLTELTTIAASTYTDTTIQIPANVIVYGVDVRVTVVIPTATTFTVTGATSATIFNTVAVSTAANSTDKGNLNCPYNNATAQNIRITPNETPADNSGRVRITIHYMDIIPATS